jgi:anthranilate synthase/aminodeoxychorismate synthase-like glutamine amidotransferase
MIDHHDSFTYNLVHDLKALGAELEIRQVDAIDPDAIDPTAYEGIVLSPGPGHPRDAVNSLALLERLAGRLPILGICLGHQIIATYLGGRVVHAPVPVHGKVFPVRHGERGLFRGLPDPTPVTRYHSLVVEEDTLPLGLEVTARTADGLIMGLWQQELMLHGVQFHPEALLTTGGRMLLENFLKEVAACSS